MTKEERALWWEMLRSERKSTHGVFAIELQDRREGPLVEALRSLAQAEPERQYMTREDCVRIARKAIAAWEALDAKPEPTLLEAAKAITTPQPFGKTISGVLVDEVMLDALKAAVEREERKGK